MPTRCARRSTSTRCSCRSQHVVFSSAYIQDAKKICARAKQVGAHVILDCYQSIGTMPLDVVDLGVSFACGGSVKYVCGGPGAAWLYVRKDLIEQFAPRVTGWFGNEAPFAFTMPDADRTPTTMWRYMGGTPAIAALYQSRAGQKIIGEIGARKIRDKSLVMTQKCIDWVDELGMKLNSPRAPPTQRGGSVVFDFVGSADVCRELNRRKFFCDHRPGVGIRIAPHFYTKAEEIDAVLRRAQEDPERRRTMTQRARARSASPPSGRVRVAAARVEAGLLRRRAPTPASGMSCSVMLLAGEMDLELGAAAAAATRSERR